MTLHVCQPCYSKVVQNERHSHKKCRISGPTSDLFNQNLPFNKILKAFRGAFKFQKLLYLKKYLKWWQCCLCLGNLISSGKRGISCCSNTSLFQPCCDSEGLARTSWTKAETSPRQLRLSGAVWCCWRRLKSCLWFGAIKIKTEWASALWMTFQYSKQYCFLTSSQTDIGWE